MDATLYNLAAIRSARNTARLTAANCPTPPDWVGLAQQSALMLHSATSFWVAYGTAMLSCHVQIMSSVCLPSSKPLAAEAPPSNWL